MPEWLRLLMTAADALLTAILWLFALGLAVLVLA